MATLLRVPAGQTVAFFSASNAASATISRGAAALQIVDGTTLNLNSTGLGIGMSPSYPLDVNGAGRISGQFTLAPSSYGNPVLAVLVSGETKNRFMMDATGLMNWGPGGSTATDTTLYRSGVGALKTDGALMVGSALSAGSDFTFTGGGAGPRKIVATVGDFWVQNTGVITLHGDSDDDAGGASGNLLVVQKGSTASPTSLLIVNNSGTLNVTPLYVHPASAATDVFGQKIKFTINYTAGSALSSIHSLYVQTPVRSAGANNVNNTRGVEVENQSMAAGGTGTAVGVYVQDQVGGTASAKYGIVVEGADTAALWLGSGADTTDAANGIAFGLSRDTNLYRAAANLLKTDDSFTVGGNLAVGGTVDVTSTSSFRDTLSLLGPTGGTMFVVRATGDSSARLQALGSGKLSWGDGAGAVDTHLYRSNPNELKTDTYFVIGNSLAVGTTINANRALRAYVSGGPASGTANYGLDVSVTRTSAVAATNWAGVMVGGTFNAAGAAADDWRALWVNNAVITTGAITTQYGLYVDPLSGAATNWAVYTAGTTPTYFGGNVGIGMTPAYPLDVTGQARISTSLGIGPQAATTSILYLNATVPSGAWQYGAYIYPTASNAASAAGLISLYVGGTTASAASPLTIPNVYGAWITCPTKGTNISANYGYSASIAGNSIGASANYTLYLTASSGGTNNYTLYAVSGSSYFGGAVGFGVSQPAYAVDATSGRFSSTLILTSATSATAAGLIRIANGDLGGGGSLRFLNATGGDGGGIYVANNNWMYIDFQQASMNGLIFRGTSGGTVMSLTPAGLLTLVVTGTAGAIRLGNDSAANLYWAATSTLKTDGNLITAKQIQVLSQGIAVTGASTFSAGVTMGGQLQVTSGGIAVTGDSTFSAGLTIGTNNASTSNVPVRLSATTLTGTSASITISSIPGGYSALQVVITCRDNTGNPLDNLLLRFNSDTGANYDMVYNGATYNESQTTLWVGYCVGGNSASTEAATTDIILPIYSGTTFYKTLLARAGHRTGAIAPAVYVFHGHWRSTSAITSITLFPSAGSFVAGTTVTVYGIP